MSVQGARYGKGVDGGRGGDFQTNVVVMEGMHFAANERADHVVILPLCGMQLLLWLHLGWPFWWWAVHKWSHLVSHQFTSYPWPHLVDVQVHHSHGHIEELRLEQPHQRDELTGL